MSKRRYKSVEFKKVDWSDVDRRVEGDRVVLAVDVAKEDFVATIMDAEPSALVTLKWRHLQERHRSSNACSGSGKGGGSKRSWIPATPMAMRWRGSCVRRKLRYSVSAPSEYTMPRRFIPPIGINCVFLM